MVLFVVVCAAWGLATTGIDECKTESAALDAAEGTTTTGPEALGGAIGYCAGDAAVGWGGLTALALAVIFVVVWRQRYMERLD